MKKSILKPSILIVALFAYQLSAAPTEQSKNQSLDQMALQQCKVAEGATGLKWDSCVDCMKGLLKGLMEDEDEGKIRAEFDACMQKSLEQQYKSNPELLEKVRASFMPKF